MKTKFFSVSFLILLTMMLSLINVLSSPHLSPREKYGVYLSWGDTSSNNIKYYIISNWSPASLKFCCSTSYTLYDKLIPLNSNGTNYFCVYAISRWDVTIWSNPSSNLLVVLTNIASSNSILISHTNLSSQQ
jgi:hypothetical protein